MVVVVVVDVHVEDNEAAVSGFLALERVLWQPWEGVSWGHGWGAASLHSFEEWCHGLAYAVIKESVAFEFLFGGWGDWIFGCLRVGWGGRKRESFEEKRIFFVWGGGLWPKIYSSSIVR